MPPIDRELSEMGEVRISVLDVIVVSQSCDIAADQKSDMWLVALCPVWRLSEAGQANAFLKSSYGKEECRRGNLPGYHMIAGLEHPNCSREISVVSFREIWSLPLDFVRRFAGSQGLRPRMKSPFREHLSQALARYFMRVGLPSEVPSFAKSDAKDETAAMKALQKLDEATRQRVLASYQPAAPPRT